MAEEAMNTAEEQVQETEIVEQESSQDSKSDTIGDAFKSEKQEESVPLAKFLEMKNENKKIARELKDLQKTIESGASNKEIKSDIRQIAEKHGLDPEFLQDFAQAVRTDAEKDLEKKFDSKLKPLEEKEKAERIEKAFTKHFDQALEDMPEFKEVVDREIIKQLSLNPANANKTFAQLIEETYGKFVPERKSFDQGSTRAGKDHAVDVDMDRMSSDSGYYQEVMANPSLKKKYNDAMTSKLSSYI